MQIHILCVAGARPNFIKVKPVIDALERAGARASLVHTGQHCDDSLSAVSFEDLGIKPPDAYLGVGSGSQAEQTAGVMVAMERLLENSSPDAVVVVGDVNSTMGAALAAAKTDTTLAHVEAGLRSNDWTMPEEINRVVTDRVSDVLFAPSENAAENLRSEGCDETRIHVVGNVMVDTLMANLDRARSRDTAGRLGLPKDFGLVTLHRPSNVDDASTFRELLGALGEVGRSIPLVFPMHPRTQKALGNDDLPAGVVGCEALGYLDFLSLEAGARLVLTDSGGVQEETTVLGIPCLTLRANTERPITITEGTNRVVGTDPAAVAAAAREVLQVPIVPRHPALWDGRAGERMADTLLDLLMRSTPLSKKA